MRFKQKIAKLLAMTVLMTALPTPLFATEQNHLMPIATSVPTRTTTGGSVEVETPGGIPMEPVIYKGEGFQVEFKVNSYWDGQFDGNFVLTNTSQQTLENWSLAFDFKHEFVNLWEAAIAQHSDQSYVLKNVGWNQDIQAGQSVTIPFIAKFESTIEAPSQYKIVGKEQTATGYTVDFKVVGDWGSGFNGELAITNTSSEIIEDWQLAFDFDHTINSFWTAKILKAENGHYIIKNDGYNGNILPGQTVKLGFDGTPGNVQKGPQNYVLTKYSMSTEEEFQIDTDGDGLPDYFEKQIGTDPIKQDTDGDKLPDGYEYAILGTNPLKKDSDDNSILDGDEDPDLDGLTTLQELELGTNPLHEDTDKDSIKDGEEVRIGTNPLYADSDNDGLEDSREIELGTDPTRADTDNDGLIDTDELTYQMDPLDPDTYDDGILDGDRTFGIELKNELEQVNDAIKVKATLNGTAKQIRNSSIEQVEENGVFLSNRVPGFLGNAYDFNIDKGVESAVITFELDDTITKRAAVDPKVYYWNEEIQLLEEVPNQLTSRSGKIISVRVDRYGKYIVIDAGEHKAIWDVELLQPDANLSENIDIVFSIDSSGSMSSNDPYGVRKSETINFINALGENDRGAVVDFDSYAYTLQPLTKDKEALKAAVNKINSSGGTDIYRGIKQALAEFSVMPQSRDKQLDLFYDETLVVGPKAVVQAVEEGEDGLVQALPTPMTINEKETRYAQRYIFLLTDGDGGYGDYNGLINEARSKKVVIYTIGLGSGVNATMLKTIAEATGGRYVNASSASELQGIFKEVSVDITDFSKDTDSDGINDYYEKKMNEGKLLLGDGTTFVGIDYNNPDCDGDTLKDGQELVVNAYGTDNKRRVYVTMKSNPLSMDTDEDGYTDDQEVGGKAALQWSVSDRDMAMLSQIIYSRDLDEVLGKTLGSLSSQQKTSINEGFEGTADIEELAEWKLVRYYTERKADSEDDLYGGFTYGIFEKDGNIIISFRGSVGSVAKTPSPTCAPWADKCEGDWHNNYHVYPYSNDPGGQTAEVVMRILANSQLLIDKKVYITGHSRGGMLAQRATSETTQHAYSDQVKRLAYFNGPGVIFNYDDGWVWGEENKQLNKVKERLQSISSKVSRHVVFNQKKKNDLTASLGSHITTSNFYPYIAMGETYDGELTAADVSNLKVVFSELHSMYHFTNRLPLYKRGNK